MLFLCPIDKTIGYGKIQHTIKVEVNPERPYWFEKDKHMESQTKQYEVRNNTAVLHVWPEGVSWKVWGSENFFGFANFAPTSIPVLTNLCPSQTLDALGIREAVNRRIAVLEQMPVRPVEEAVPVALLEADAEHVAVMDEPDALAAVVETVFRSEDEQQELDLLKGISWTAYETYVVPILNIRRAQHEAEAKVRETETALVELTEAVLATDNAREKLESAEREYDEAWQPIGNALETEKPKALLAAAQMLSDKEDALTDAQQVFDDADSDVSAALERVYKLRPDLKPDDTTMVS